MSEQKKKPSGAVADVFRQMEEGGKHLAEAIQKNLSPVERQSIIESGQRYLEGVRKMNEILKTLERGDDALLTSPHAEKPPVCGK
jgi:hypothetical protein